MLVLLGSENESVSQAIRDFFQQRPGHELRQFPINELVVRTPLLRPDCVILVLTEDPESTITALCEIQETRPVRVLVVGPSSDAKLILRIMREGAFHYVDETELEEGLTAALKKLRNEPPPTSDHGRVIAVMGMIGGCGASMLAVNLAATYADKRQSVCLLDLRLEAGDLASLLNLRPQHSISDLCTRLDRMDRSMFTQCFANHASGVQLLAAPLSYKEVPRVTPRGLRRVLSMARSEYHYVVVDVDRNYRAEQAQVLLQADAVLLVLRPDIPSLRQTQRVLEYLSELNVSRKKMHLVVNRIRRRDVTLKDVESALGLPVKGIIPEDVKRVDVSINRGDPMVLKWPRADVSARISELATMANGHMPSGGT